jgi:MSHA biogenesis protein MshN
MGVKLLSVINQMLKDLDKRQIESGSALKNSTNSTFISSKELKPWLLVLITVSITLLLVYVFSLYQQNKQLLTQQLMANKPVSTEIQTKANTVITTKVTTSEHNQSNGQHSVNSQSVDQNGDTRKTTALQKTAVTANTNFAGIAAKDVSIITDNNIIATDANTKVSNITKKNANKKLITTERISTPNSATVKNGVVNKVKSNTQLTKKVTEKSVTSSSSMSVSRRQLTSSQLAAQKMTQAEQALANNNIAKAEKLFEEVLMLQADNKTARKQLAALWFGRKAYQAAINILAQGIALAPENSEYRLMQARIYLTQGQTERAYQILQGLQSSDNIEYLATQARIAQQLTQYEQAIKNYQQLAKMQPDEARWWLGLAVAYDANKQYSLALQAYQSAQAQGNLSASSLNFVEQRMQELRE